MPTLRFRLPGDWWATSLLDREAAIAAATRLIRHRIGTTDDRSALRARLRREFTAAIDEAIAGNGQSMFLAIQLVDGLPLPITITVYLLDVELVPAVGTRGDRVLGILRQGLEGSADTGDLTALELAGTSALRRDRIRATAVGSGDDSGSLDVLIVDYWLAVPDTKRVVLVNFSTSMAGLREHLLPFFDALMRVAYWEKQQQPDR
ncbi:MULTISPECIES: hypothetical protein [unclassified Cryobacterium]|uniref:hypothetical protein n=1 Tax=unclassified Cryobacterium TaxID=2649013 RepID=UPI00144758BC|nr:MULTISPECIES: hypothetical protein [unclassified Cryobacterium]